MEAGSDQSKQKAASVGYATVPRERPDDLTATGYSDDIEKEDSIDGYQVEEGEAEEWREQVETLQAKVEERDRKINELTRAARQNDETSRKLEDVQLYLDCIAKLTKMVTGGDDKEEVVLNLTKQICTLENEKSELRKRVTQLEDEVKKRDRDFTMKVPPSPQSPGEEQLYSMSMKLEEIKQLLAEKEAENANLRIQLETFADEGKMFREQSESLKKEKEALAEQLKQKMEEHSKDGKAQLTSQVDALGNSESRLAEQAGGYHQSTSIVTRNEAKRWMSETANLLGKLEKLREEKEEENEELQEAEEKITELTEKVQAMKQENISMRGQLEAYKIQADIFEEDFKQEREDRAKVAGKSDDIQQSLVAVETEFQKSKDLSQELRCKLEEKTREAETLRNVQREMNQWIVTRGDVFVAKKAEELGRGGWGYVVKGAFRRKTVAVKCIFSVIASEVNLDRVRREINTMALLRHPNLVLFIAAVMDNPDGPLIVTELLDTDLRSAYENKSLTDKNKLSILLDVALALNYLHTLPEPIIHRDVSSRNVLLERATWKAKLSDFGSARLAALARTKGEGCFAYAAPEMFPPPPFLESAAKLSPVQEQTTKVDSFSFGILLCELMMEEEPGGDVRMRKQQIEAFGKRWRRFRSIVTSCVKDKPAKRPSMEDIIQDLSKIKI